MNDAAEATLVYTLTDEAPALATRSLLPIVASYAATAGVDVETRDISLAARILAAFDDRLDGDWRREDALAELGRRVNEPTANIVKLPNISASLPQLEAAIDELRAQGAPLPGYPEDDDTSPDAADVRARYRSVMGSAVNPVLREGNSDRRAPAAVKQYAHNHPHRMGPWSPESRTNVATMTSGDFRSTEQSITARTHRTFHLVFVADDGSAPTELRDPLPVEAGTVVDSAVMRRSDLDAFLAEAIAAAKERDVLFSVHLKATMMKVSDPVIFGHVVRAYFADVFERFGDRLAEADFSPDTGLGSLDSTLENLDSGEADEIRAAIAQAMVTGPRLAMVDSERGITNLHVPSDVIVDASMPAMIRNSGHMWGPDGEEDDTLAVIPDHSYAEVYQEVIDFCRERGAFDPATMGSVPNVGLMARKAEEYGSHDKTFTIPGDGRVEVRDADGALVFEHAVEAGDIWRMCTVVRPAIDDWVGLAVRRSRASGTPAVFWLDEDRPHDAQLIERVTEVLASLDTDGLDLGILAPAAATRLSCERIANGEDVISVTGNVLRDYLTDLFPILEVGTSAKMLSIVPLMAGGGLFETGAGGSAPKHVQQFVAENHLRWDSLGEFLALGASLEHLAEVFGNPKAQVLADTLDAATGRLLEEGRSPSRSVGELDNRGSHAYLAAFWAEALAEQTADSDLATRFAPLADRFRAELDTIIEELDAVQGEPVDLGGYYHPDEGRITAAMRPSPTLNSLVASLALD